MTGLKVAAKHLALTLLLKTLVMMVQAAEPTAFELMKEGSRDVAVEARDRVIQIRSEKSVGGLTPSVWVVAYCDPRMKTTEVKFDRGQKRSARRLWRFFKRPKAVQALLDRSKLIIDSDQALTIARQDGLLEKVKLTHSRMTLENWEEIPVWKVYFWAESPGPPGKIAEVGEIFVHASDGKVVHRDLHLDRLQ